MKLQLSDGSEISVETELSQSAFDAQAVTLAAAKVTFAETIRTGGLLLKDSIEWLKNELDEQMPESMEIQIGLKIGTEGSVVLAKGTAEAAISLKATWKK